MDHNSALQKTFLILPEKSSFEVPNDRYIRIERFTLAEDNSEFFGLRIVIYANVTSTTKDNREISVKTAISSFIVGQDFEQSADLIFSPSDKAVISATGPNLTIQITYSEFTP